MLYVMKMGAWPTYLVGSAAQVADIRRRRGLARFRKKCDPPLRVGGGLPGLTVLRMFEGDESDAAAFYAAFAPEAPSGPLDVPFFRPTPEFDSWVAANTRPWDGRESEALGVKGLGPAVRLETPPAPLGSMTDRLAKRRR